VVGKRQKPISKKNLERWVNQDPMDFCTTPEAVENYNRNRKLIDLTCIPEQLATEIVSYYKALNSNEKKVPLEYFQQHQTREVDGRFCIPKYTTTF